MSENILFLGNKIFEIPPFFQTRPRDLGEKVHACSLRFSALNAPACLELMHAHAAPAEKKKQNMLSMWFKVGTQGNKSQQYVMVTASSLLIYKFGD